MSARMWGLIFLAGLANSTVVNGAPAFTEIASPDNSLTARVRTNQDTHEGSLEIRLPDGAVLAEASGVSEDGQHGWGINQAAWTPDSQFLVFSTGLTAGHQPWSSPVWVFDRKRSRIFGLSTLGVMAVESTTKFRLDEPDLMTVVALACNPGAGIETRLLRFRLSSVIANNGDSVRCHSPARDER